MGRGRIRSLPAVVAVVVAASSVSWSPYSSTIYPYSISQPSTFKHIMLPDTSSRKVDFWFPTLGSRTTNLAVSAEPGNAILRREVDYLHGFGGRSVHRVGSIRVAGQNRPLFRASFRSRYVAPWVEEGITFVVCQMVWHVTMSYEVRYKSLRPTLLHMMRSFRLRC